MTNREPTAGELMAELTDLYNDLQMAVAPPSYSRALLHCIASLRASCLAAELIAGQRRTPSAARVLPFRPAPLNRSATMSRHSP